MSLGGQNGSCGVPGGVCRGAGSAGIGQNWGPSSRRDSERGGRYLAAPGSHLRPTRPPALQWPGPSEGLRCGPSPCSAPACCGTPRRWLALWAVCQLWLLTTLAPAVPGAIPGCGSHRGAVWVLGAASGESAPCPPSPCLIQKRHEVKALLINSQQLPQWSPGPLPCALPVVGARGLLTGGEAAARWAWRPASVVQGLHPSHTSGAPCGGPDLHGGWGF